MPQPFVPDPPAELTACAPAPSIPADPTGGDVGRYILQLDAAGADCRHTLADLVDWQRDAARRFAP